MPKFNIESIEFYITNVCNLTCSDCRTFNNHKFKGHYEFQSKLYRPWADILDIRSIEILGGEPALHPRLDTWIIGLRDLWPHSEINLSSNGTYLRQLTWLHDIAAEYDINIKISAHSRDLRPKIVNEIFATFGYCEISDIKRCGDRPGNEVDVKTKKGVNIFFRSYENFQISPLRNNRFEFYQSDPVKAHRTCKISNCHHMIDGLLYKCGFVGTAANFLTQQRQPVPELLHQYRPLAAADITDQSVLDQLKNYIPQCSLCHESNPKVHIESRLKKSIKIHNLITTNKIPV